MALRDDGYILNTTDLANTSTNVEGWEVVTTPQAGDVAVYKGHMGIVYQHPDIGTYTISASYYEGTIVVNRWGFRSGDNPVFWRYTGGE